MKVPIITYPDTINNNNVLINKPNIELNDAKKLVLSNLSNLDDCAGMCKR